MPSSGATACAACSAGYYQFSPGQSSCVQCDNGTFSGASGSPSCTRCPVGSYLADAGGTACIVCPVRFRSHRCALLLYALRCAAYVILILQAGSYQPLDAQTSCSYCLNGQPHKPDFSMR